MPAIRATRRCSRGSHAATRTRSAQLYDHFGRVAYGLALRILRDERLAEDAVQEAFLAVWRQAASYRPDRAKAQTWVLTLVHRRAVDLVRREERRRADVLEPESEAGAVGSAADDAELRDRRAAVQRALEQLPEEQRRPIELAYYGGLEPVRAGRATRRAARHDQEPHVHGPEAPAGSARPRALSTSIPRAVIAVPTDLKGRSFTRVSAWSADELIQVLDLADRLKELQARREEHRLLPGRTLGMIFQKPSTRTRVSFEVGIWQLGGIGLYLSASDLQLGRGETIRDTAVVLSRYLDAIMIRTFAQDDVEELAEHADIPVINGLTDDAHPCQALADLMTIRERLGRLEGVRLAYLGDGNNVCASLMVAAAKLGLELRRRDARGLRPAGRSRGERARSRRRVGRQRRARPRPARGRREAQTCSTPTSGRAWARRPSASGGCATWPATGSTSSCSRRPARTRSSSTACRRTTARRSSRACSTARSRPSGTRPRTACTRRRRCCALTVR